MKTYAAIFFGLCMLMQGGAFAADTKADDKAAPALKKQVAFESGNNMPTQARTGACKSGEPGCPVSLDSRSCGAYVQLDKRYGYGFGQNSEEATSRARDMCGLDACQVVVSSCEE